MLLLALSCTGPTPTPAVAQTPPPAAAPQIGTHAVSGSVDGTPQSSDEFLWRTLAEFAKPYTEGQHSPVVFETWASDTDTFSQTPKWPDPSAEKSLQRSVLQAQKHPGFEPIDEACTPPPGAAVAGFPSTGCIAEETKRNKAQFDYIVDNGLNTQAGLAARYAANQEIAMPTTAISVKGDWVPVEDLLTWLPELESLENIRQQYYTNTSDGVEYAVVSLHVSSRQNPNWVWGSWEHQNNPGRCDVLGCWDSFGAKIPEVQPNMRDRNSQYGACEKSPELAAILSEAGLDPAWSNYCLKATMVDYSAPDGTPYVLGNSVIEGVVGNGTVAASSCIACHVYASFDATGSVPEAAENMLPYNPTGEPIDGVLDEALKFDFMWGVIKAP